ncbi:hypothetical protein QCA50_003699 [Cerrena zonata]|uniref:Roadblock/LAMTOR2 domain-containing protein n=1 Tax=Cerrena zonata TaxID=2478898 RepID=A0AAW0GKK6_9APHY
MSLKNASPNFSLSATEGGTTTTTATHLLPPELEQTFALLTSHRSVLGYLLLSRGPQVAIIRHSGVVFEGDQGKKYAHAVERIVESVHTGLEEVAGESGDVDEIRFMRIRTKRHELLISPDGNYLLAVLHDPSTT